MYECIHLVSNIFFYAILEENVLGTTIFIMMRSISALAPPARQLRILMPSLMLGWKRKLVPAENFVWRRVAADELSRSNELLFPLMKIGLISVDLEPQGTHEADAYHD